jgi:hypothetical protein
MEKSSKVFLALVDAFYVFVVQQKEITTQNQEITKLMSCIVEGLGVIENAPSRGFTKATIKARLPNSFARKEMKLNKCSHGYTQYKHIWKHSTSKLIRKKFISVKVC